MYKIKNLIGSPMTVYSASGSKILPANGEIEIDLSEQYLAMIRACRFIEITDIGSVQPDLLNQESEVKQTRKSKKI